MRILLDYRPALRQRTGVGEFVHELARALASGTDRDELTLLTSSWKDRPAPSLRSELPGVSIADHRIPVRVLTWAWNRLEWPPAEWLGGSADVVHAQSPLLIPAASAAQVITIHDLNFLSHPEWSEAEMRRDFPALVHKHARRADHIVVSSHYGASQVQQRLDIPRERITVCPPGAPAWTTSVARDRTAAGSSSSILFLGTIEPRKNISGLLDAYARLRAARPDTPPLVLAGQTRDSMRRELAAIERAPLAGHVRLLGYVEDRDRPALYRDARMLVLPSFEEGFGLPVLEAMACGVPVVISNRGSLPEVAADAATPIDPDKPESLTAEMLRLLDPDAAAAASRAGLARASAFTWDACARAVREAYRTAVAARAERH